jgi:hypothetical protein
MDMMKLSTVADTMGKGILAGLAGTAAMTAAQMVDQRLTGGERSDAPVEAMEKVLRVEPKDEQGEQRLSNITHWAYGTGWGVPRAALGAVGMPAPVATVLHFGLLWGGALVMLPALRLAPPASEWERNELTKDAMFHLLYVAAAGLAYQLLDRRDRRVDA